MKSAKHIHGEPHSKEQEYLAGWKRARAELDNFRKRMAKEQTEQGARLKRNLVEPLLEVADNFTAIIEHVPPEQKDNNWTQGVLHVARQLDQVLTEFEVKKIGSVGEAFDPAIHEAGGEEKSEQHQAGVVVKVIRPGYQVGELVIRPARVTVSK